MRRNKISFTSTWFGWLTAKTTACSNDWTGWRLLVRSDVLQLNQLSFAEAPFA